MNENKVHSRTFDYKITKKMSGQPKLFQKSQQFQVKSDERLNESSIYFSVDYLSVKDAISLIRFGSICSEGNKEEEKSNS